MTLVEKAEKFATEAHGSIGQKRRYTFEPYINHPAAVVRILQSINATEEVLAAGWLHDVPEDTPVTVEQIRQEFGEAITELVLWLTDVSKPENGNRAERRHIDLLHTAQAPPAAKTVKLADLIHNTESIAAYDPKFAAVYMSEKRALLSVLSEGNPHLFQVASEQVCQYFANQVLAEIS